MIEYIVIAILTYICINTLITLRFTLDDVFTPTNIKDWVKLYCEATLLAVPALIYYLVIICRRKLQSSTAESQDR